MVKVASELVISLEFPTAGFRDVLTFPVSSALLDGTFDTVTELVHDLAEELCEGGVKHHEKLGDEMLEGLRSQAKAHLEEWEGKLAAAQELKVKGERAVQNLKHMRETYYKELSSYRQQLSLKSKAEANGEEFHAEPVNYFDPTEYVDDELASVLSQKVEIMEQNHKLETRRLLAQIDALTEQVSAKSFFLNAKDELVSRWKEDIVRRDSVAVQREEEDEEEEEEQVNDECNAVEEGKEEGEEVVGSSSEVAVKDKSRPRKEVAAPSRATKPRSVSGNGKVHKTRRVQQPIAPWGDGRMLGAAGGPTMANLVGLLPTSVGQMLRRKVDFLEIDDEIPISAVSSDWSWTFVRSSDGVMCSRAALFFDPNNRHGSRTWGRSAHGAIVVAIRGRVSFDKMARRAEAAGAVALVVVNNHSKWDESFEMGAESVGFAGLYLAAPRVPAILVPKSAKDLLCVSSQERQLRGKIVRR
mmetsp:Transcript_4095/g.9703  ORF Transcript_4095/g.9703 Transcript_4095/m.9703 type:complete len:470 (+) Transcript_4095:220-1629(+)